MASNKTQNLLIKTMIKLSNRFDFCDKLHLFGEEI